MIIVFLCTKYIAHTITPLWLTASIHKRVSRVKFILQLYLKECNAMASGGEAPVVKVNVRGKDYHYH